MKLKQYTFNEIATDTIYILLEYILFGESRLWYETGVHKISYLDMTNTTLSLKLDIKEI